MTKKKKKRRRSRKTRKTVKLEKGGIENGCRGRKNERRVGTYMEDDEEGKVQRPVKQERELKGEWPKGEETLSELTAN